MRNVTWIACCAALIGATPAAGVELKTLTAQVNPKSDPDGSISQPALVADASGGFAVVWGKLMSETRTSRVYARFFTSKDKPKGAAVRVDGPLDGETPAGASRVSAAALGGDRMIVTWSASGFSDGSRPKGVGRLCEDGGPAGKVLQVEDEPGTAIARTVELNDERAIVGWSTDDAPMRLSGRFVEPDGKLGKPKLAFAVDGSGSLPLLHPVEEGVLAVAYRTAVGGTEVAAQIYDAKGRSRGDAFVLVDAAALPSFSALPVGLAGGDFVVLDCAPPSGSSVCDVTAQRFKKSGRKAGQAKTLLRGVRSQSMQAVSLGGDGLLLALEEFDPDGRARIVYRRFDAKLKKAGPAASTQWLLGQRRGPMRRLADGRAAAVIFVANSDLFVQTLEP